jgi:DNA recombination-mediator protein A
MRHLLRDHGRISGTPTCVNAQDACYARCAPPENAAFGCTTIVVEAASRSGSMNTARHATQLARPLMAVPGPVTSALSAGCHELIRERGAAYVTSAADVLTHVSQTPA